MRRQSALGTRFKLDFVNDFLFLPGKAYRLSLPDGYVKSLSFYADEGGGEMSLQTIGKWPILAGFNTIPVNLYASSLELEVSSKAFLKRFSLQGEENELEGGAFDLFSAIYPTSSALYSAWLTLPNSSTQAVKLPGVLNASVRAFYSSTLPAHASASSMAFQALTSFPIPGAIEKASLSYRGEVSINGAPLPLSNQSAALWQWPKNSVQVGSQSANVDVGLENSITLEATAGEVEAFSLYREGDSLPFISFDSSTSLFRAGFSPEDFASLTFLPLTGWLSVTGELPLPFALYGGVLRLDFTNLPAGLTASQQQLIFRAYDKSASAIKNIEPPADEGQKSENLVPITLKSAPQGKISSLPPSPALSTPFYGPSSGLVLPSGAAFQPSEINNLETAPALLADTSNEPTAQGGGFTGSTWLSKMGYSIAAENVQTGSRSYPIQSNQAFIDPSLFNGRTVTFSRYFQSIQLAPGAAPAGFEIEKPLPLDMFSQPENIYSQTPSLNGFWSDDTNVWESSSIVWGMDNPNLSFDYTPDLTAPFATLSAFKPTKIFLGSANDNRPGAFSLSYLLPTGGQASLILDLATGSAQYPLTADGNEHTKEIRFASHSSAAVSLSISGTIYLYSAVFKEGAWSLSVTTDQGWHAPIDGIFYGDTVNLGFPTKSLTFSFVPIAPALTSLPLPSGFLVQANCDPGWNEENVPLWQPLSAWFWMCPSSISANAFFQCRAMGLNMAASMENIPPDCISWGITSNPQGAFSYWGGGWFFCSKSGATCTVTAVYGGISLEGQINS